MTLRKLKFFIENELSRGSTLWAGCSFVINFIIIALAKHNAAGIPAYSVLSDTSVVGDYCNYYISLYKSRHSPLIISRPDGAFFLNSLTANRLSSLYLSNLKSIPSTHPIIAILQKVNICHKSSDDDPSQPAFA